MKYSQISFIIFLVIIFSSHISTTHCVDGKRSKAEEDDIEIERKLRVLNKKPVKTIITKIGDIIDCIDIYKQPAFDNPLLKDHKIQMNPNSIPGEKTTNKKNSSSSTFHWLQSEKCPSGTVPIRRTTRQDLVNAKYFTKNAKPTHAEAHPNMGVHFVSASEVEVTPPKSYFGAAASISIHNLTVDADQFSAAQIWIMNGTLGRANSIEFGLMQNPSIFGDSRTRLFGYWTADGHRATGCYNMLCEGFVQISQVTGFGSQFAQASIYGILSRFAHLMVSRAQDTGHWWLSVGPSAEVTEPIGYWPANLFTDLVSSAADVRYGGFAGATSQRSSPPMGNGHLPQLEDFDRTAFMSKMKYANQMGQFVDIDPHLVQTVRTARPNCYDIKFAGQLEGWGVCMTYGGPGGMCDDTMRL